MLFLFVCFMGFFSCERRAVIDLSSYSSREGDSRRQRSTGNRSSRQNRGNECEDFERCEDICDQIMDTSGERRECYKLSLEDIGVIEEVFDILKKPPRPPVRPNINQSDFDLFAEFALHSWVRLIDGLYRASIHEDDEQAEREYGHRGKYRPYEAKSILDLISSDASMGGSLFDFDYGEDVVRSLFKQCGSGNGCGDAVYSGYDENEDAYVDYNDNDKQIVKGLKGNNMNYLNHWEARAQDEDSFPAFDLAHAVIKDVCASAKIENVSLSVSESYQFCMTYIYICEAEFNRPSGGGGIDRYIEGTYKTHHDFPSCDVLTTQTLHSQDLWDDIWE